MGRLQYNTQHRFEDMKDVVTDDSDGKGVWEYAVRTQQSTVGVVLYNNKHIRGDLRDTSASQRRHGDG